MFGLNKLIYYVIPAQSFLAYPAHMEVRAYGQLQGELLWFLLKPGFTCSLHMSAAHNYTGH